MPDATRSRLCPWRPAAAPARGSPQPPVPTPPLPHFADGDTDALPRLPAAPSSLAPAPGARGWRHAERGLPDGCNLPSAGLRHLPSLFPPSPSPCPPPPPAHAFLHISACKGLLSQRLDLLLWGGGRCILTPSLARVPHSQAQTGPRDQARCCPCVLPRPSSADHSGAFSGPV